LNIFEIKKIKVAIEGAAGYTAGELLRILLFHPFVEVKYVHSESNAGKPVYAVHKDLLGETELVFNDIDFNDTDVVFLCKGHGQSVKFMEQNNLPEHVKVIDLSTDFRDESAGFVYGLPELQREKIKTARLIANPGCFATSIELALLPLASAGLLKNEVHITSITGSTGAGQSPSETTHFSWRNNNVSVYKPFRHQHLKEIGMCINKLQPGFHKSVNLVPVRGNFSRGILTSCYTECSESQAEIDKLYHDFYQSHPFTVISKENPDLKQVVNTNKCILYLERFEDKLYILSLVDNLIKGASGQAVQNMNLMFGIPEDTGLRLKPIGF
jgi:N-acetyl-gamma-glutamyl-phosphate reductase